MKLKIFSSDGGSSREQDFPEIPSFEGDKGLHAVKEVVVAIQANARQGTRSTKTRAEVSGGGKKPWRQKGTGRARAGSIRSPIWVGGGVVFGPRPRDFSKKVNAKVKALAFRRAFFDRAVSGEVDLIEKFEVEPVKTKAMDAIVQQIAPEGKVLIVDAAFAPETVRAARNLERVEMQEASRLNTLDLCRYQKLILSTSALEALLPRLRGSAS